jgi:hypothetical protein
MKSTMLIQLRRRWLAPQLVQIKESYQRWPVKGCQQYCA